MRAAVELVTGSNSAASTMILNNLR
jgi:hypothetical protein